MSNMDRLTLYSDRDLIMAALERNYTGECFVKVVRPYSWTSTIKTMNGKVIQEVSNVEYERIEFGHPMDVYTQWVEFDQKGKLIRFGQNSHPNY